MPTEDIGVVVKMIGKVETANNIIVEVEIDE